MLDDVERRDDVEGGVGEPRVEWIADEDLRRDRPGLGGRHWIDLDAGHAPADHLHLMQEPAVGAADVEQSPLAEPRRKVFADLASMQARPGARPRARAGGVEMAIAEPGRQRPAP